MTGPGFFHRSLSVAFILLFFAVPKGNTAVNINGIGSRSIAMGGATVSLQDPFSAFYNQAGLANLSHVSLSSFYQQNGLIQGYADIAGIVCLPASSGTFALTFLQTGIEGYKESRAGISFAKLLSPKFSAGMQFNYFIINLPESYTNKGTVVFEGGFQYSANKKLFVGFHFFNPFNAGIKTLYSEKNLDRLIRCGAGFSLGQELVLVSGIDYIPGATFCIRAGFEYILAGNFFLRGGISGKPLFHYFGCGYKWKRLSIDMALPRKGVLSYSPSISFNYIL